MNDRPTSARKVSSSATADSRPRSIRSGATTEVGSTRTHPSFAIQTSAQAWADYGLAHLQGGLATSMVTGGSMDLSNERARNLIATMSRRHITAAMDHDGMAQLIACIDAN